MYAKWNEGNFVRDRYFNGMPKIWVDIGNYNLTIHNTFHYFLTFPVTPWTLFASVWIVAFCFPRCQRLSCHWKPVVSPDKVLSNPAQVSAKLHLQLPSALHSDLTSMFLCYEKWRPYSFSAFEGSGPTHFICARVWPSLRTYVFWTLSLF